MSYPSDRFAAALAHCLNSESATLVMVEPGALYVRLLDLLAARYADVLLHHPVYASRMSEEEAASRYFDATIARRLILSGSVQLSIAHRLFAALCQRGTSPGWRDAAVAREKAVAVDGGQAVEDSTMAPVRQRLRELPQELSPGSASATLRARHGAVVLRVGDETALVPEEIALWDAIATAPRSLIALARGEPFNRFCSVIIDGLRTANRPIQELLSLGRRLCPFDWLGVLSIQQVRALNRLLRGLEAAGMADSPEHWAVAFAEAPVPGFNDAAALWESDIGQALRTGSSTRSAVGLAEIAELADPDDVIDEFLDEREFLQQLALLRQDAIINALEERILCDLYRGADLGHVAGRAEVRAALRFAGIAFEQLLTDLQRRIARWQDTGDLA